MKQSLRKSNYVDRQVQGKLARRLVIHWLLFLVAAIGLAFGSQWMSAPLSPLSEQIDVTWERYGLLLTALVCMVPIFVYDSIRLSNRFTGPMLRLRRATHELAEGTTPSKIKLRKGDFWQEIATDFNRLIERQECSDSSST